MLESFLNVDINRDGAIGKIDNDDNQNSSSISATGATINPQIMDLVDLEGAWIKEAILAQPLEQKTLVSDIFEEK